MHIINTTDLIKNKRQTAVGHESLINDKFELHCHIFDLVVVLHVNKPLLFVLCISGSSADLSMLFHHCHRHHLGLGALEKEAFIVTVSFEQ